MKTESMQKIINLYGVRGFARAFGISPGFASRMFSRGYLSHKSAMEVFEKHPELKWEEIINPKYLEPESMK